MRRYGWWILGVAAIAARLAFAADPAVELYEQAQKSLDRGSYREAAEAFSRVAADYPKSSQAEKALYFKAFSLYRLGDARALRDAYATLAQRAKMYKDASMAGDAATLEIRIDTALAEKGDEDAARRVRTRVRTIEKDRHEDSDLEMKIAALNALMQMDPERALPVLRKVLGNRDADSRELRSKAVFIVSQLEGPEALDILTDVIRNDPDSGVREQAVFWLSQIDDERAADMLIEILKSSTDADLKAKAVFALSQHDSPRAFRALQDAVVDASLPESVREQAIFAISQTDAPGTTRFLVDLYDKVSAAALKEKVIFAVSQTDGEEGKTWLLSLVRRRSEDIEMRKKALFWAGQQGDLTMAELNGLWSSDADPELKDQIIFVLSQQGDRVAVDRLIEIARTEKDPELRRKAVFWLGQTDDPKALEFLERLISE